MTQSITTPYFMIDEQKLLRNLKIAKQLKEASGVKLVLALKCFSTWGVFDRISPYLDGTTSSGPFEVCLGHETFGGETHAYSVGFSESDVRSISNICDKLIFNSLSQYQAYAHLAQDKTKIGLRINPGFSYAGQDLANPARAFSRLGVPATKLTLNLFNEIDGIMFHMNCENKSAVDFVHQLGRLSSEFGAYLNQVDWVSLGGGVLFTWSDYDVALLAKGLKEFSERHQVQVYLEPGEAIVTQTTDLVVSVVDIVDNGKKTAIVDSATEAHRLDTLIYNEPATIKESMVEGKYEYVIGSCSCLAGDQFCESRFDEPLFIGQKLHIQDSGGYTMVKLNWFNGLRMPDIYCRTQKDEMILLNRFTYDDFKAASSKWKLLE